MTTLPTRPILAAVLSLATCFSGSALAAKLDEQAHINVNGTAAIRVVPDEVLVRLAVLSRHATLAGATDDNARKVARVLEVARKHSVSAQDVQMNQMRIQPIFDNRQQPQEATRYDARRVIELKLTQTKQLEPLVAALHQAGVEEIQNIEWRSSDMAKHRDRARELAARAARDKADALTAELGVKRGKAVRISEESNRWSAPSVNSRDVRRVAQGSPGDDDDGGGDSAAGLISVTASVNVTFLID